MSLSENENKAAALLCRMRGDGILAARVFVRRLKADEVLALAKLQDAMADSLAKDEQSRLPLPADYAETYTTLLNAISDRLALEAQTAEETRKRDEVFAREAAAVTEANVSQETKAA
jgi:hypothetical protein